MMNIMLIHRRLRIRNNDNIKSSLGLYARYYAKACRWRVPSMQQAPDQDSAEETVVSRWR